MVKKLTNLLKRTLWVLLSTAAFLAPYPVRAGFAMSGSLGGDASGKYGDLMSGGSTSVATLTSFDGIGTADNPDGTVTVTVPLSVTGDKRFFKIVTE